MAEIKLEDLITRATISGDVALTLGSDGQLVMTPTASSGSNLVVPDQNLNATNGENLSITLGPATNNGNIVAYTLTGGGAANYTASTTNTGVFNSSVDGTELVNVAGDDNNGGTDTGVITISISAILPAPVITTQPQPQIVTEPNAATFSVVATNATTYQWYENNIAINGQTGTSLVINPTAVNVSGNTYKVDVVGSSTITSNVVTLTVNASNVNTAWQGNIIAGDDNVLRSDYVDGSSPVVLVGQLRVFLQDGSVTTGGVFDNQGTVIEDQDATWDVMEIVDLGGSFNFYDGGSYDYLAGTTIGTASFTIRVTDGANVAFTTIEINVQ